MPPSKKVRDATSNDRLRELVQASGLTQVAALALYNKGLNALAKCSDHSWKSYFSEVTSKRWRHVKPEVLERAEKVFGAML